jgi:hypothetical protein
MRSYLIPSILALALLGFNIPAWAVPGHTEGYIPAAARGAGQFESFWTTDVWIYHQGASGIHLWFNPAGQDNTSGQSVVVELNEAVVHLADIVGSVFETEGIGSIHYLSDGPVTVISRTWTVAPEGGGYGQTIPGVPVGSASFAGAGQGGALRMLVDQGSSARANLGIVNVSPVALTAAVDIFTADGQEAPGNSSFTVDLAPFDMTQIGDVLSRLPAGERNGLVIRVAVASSDGAILAYLSEVDNTTNDASYQEGFKFSF